MSFSRNKNVLIQDIITSNVKQYQVKMFSGIAL